MQPGKAHCVMDAGGHETGAHPDTIVPMCLQHLRDFRLSVNLRLHSGKNSFHPQLECSLTDSHASDNGSGSLCIARQRRASPHELAVIQIAGALHS